MLALILGIVSIVLCQILGPFAWVIGRRAVKEIDASGGAYGGRAQAMVGYVLGLVTTILMIIGVVVVIVVVIIAAANSSTT